MSTPEQLIPESELKARGAFETLKGSVIPEVPKTEQASAEAPVVVPGLDVAPEVSPEVPVVPVTQEQTKPNTIVADFLDGHKTAAQIQEEKESGKLSAADIVNGLLKRTK